MIPHPADVRERLLDAIRSGCSRATAAQRVGLAPDVVERLCRLGLEPGARPEWRELVEGVLVAEAEQQAHVVGRLMARALEDLDGDEPRCRAEAMRMLRWWLERRHPEQWDAVRAASARAAVVQATASAAPDLTAAEMVQLLEDALVEARRRLGDDGA